MVRYRITSANRNQKRKSLRELAIASAKINRERGHLAVTKMETSKTRSGIEHRRDDSKQSGRKKKRAPPKKKIEKSPETIDISNSDCEDSADVQQQDTTKLFCFPKSLLQSNASACQELIESFATRMFPSTEISANPRCYYQSADSVIPVSAKCYHSLDGDTNLNDSIIDLVMILMSRHITDENSKDMFHIFPSKLAAEIMSAKSEKRFYSYMTRANIFKKCLLLIPWCSDKHWSLFVVVNPGRITISSSERQSLLCHFDSLNHHKTKKCSLMIRHWLNRMWNYHKSQNSDNSMMSCARRHPFTIKSCPECKVTGTNEHKLPQQRDIYNCGIYVIMYAHGVLGLMNKLQPVSNHAIGKKVIDNLVALSPHFRFHDIDCATSRSIIQALLIDIANLVSTPDSADWRKKLELCMTLPASEKTITKLHAHKEEGNGEPPRKRNKIGILHVGGDGKEATTLANQGQGNITAETKAGRIRKQLIIEGTTELITGSHAKFTKRTTNASRRANVLFATVARLAAAGAAAARPAACSSSTTDGEDTNNKRSKMRKRENSIANEKQNFQKVGNLDASWKAGGWCCVSVQLGLDPSPDEEITICGDGVPPIDEHPVLQLLSSFWGEIH